MTNKTSPDLDRARVMAAIERGGLNPTQMQQIIDVADAIGLPQEFIEKVQAQLATILPHGRGTCRACDGHGGLNADCPVCGGTGWV